MPVSAAAYADALIGRTETPWGAVDGLGADAVTLNPLLGEDSLEPFVDAAAAAGAGLFVLVRTSNPGAADFLDADTVPGRSTSGSPASSTASRTGSPVRAPSAVPAPSSAPPSRGSSIASAS